MRCINNRYFDIPRATTTAALSTDTELGNRLVIGYRLWTQNRVGDRSPISVGSAAVGLDLLLKEAMNTI